MALPPLRRRGASPADAGPLNWSRRHRPAIDGVIRGQPGVAAKAKILLLRCGGERGVKRACGFVRTSRPQKTA